MKNETSSHDQGPPSEPPSPLSPLGLAAFDIAPERAEHIRRRAHASSRRRAPWVRSSTGQ
jgi:hypothetical protein